VAEIEYYESGGVRRAVLRERWDRSRVVFPEELE
jgi:hypothetical protein